MSDGAAATADVVIESFLAGDGALAELGREVREGLTRPLRELPPKLFYDDRGSELFERITALPEYYLTRCEREILNRRAPEIVALSGARELVELGSGVASKTRALLFAMAGAGTLRRYVPVDVSGWTVRRCADELAEAYPGLAVHGIVGDFRLHLGRIPAGGRRLVAFLGSTIGNLQPPERARFLAAIAALLDDDDRFLLGVDLVKNVGVLEAAYDDELGVTAEFNRNALLVVNRLLGADFDPPSFAHVAFFDPSQEWIEMRLRSLRPQRVSIPGARLELELAAGEAIRTEVSAKFTPARVERELAAAGMALEELFTDERGWFGLALARRA